MFTQRCFTSILFSDLSQMNHRLESLDPEPVAHIQTTLRHMAEQVVNDHGGVVNQFYGDGMLAAFGLSEPQKNCDKRAINAALELHQAVKKVEPPTNIYLPGFEVNLQSGIHSGVVAIQQGDPIQGRYKLTGDALNTAARLAARAEPNQILVSDETIGNILSFFVADTAIQFQLKGKSKPVKAYPVLDRRNTN
mgnify:CR=1 FL=1